jgi:hypothetical protein
MACSPAACHGPRKSITVVRILEFFVRCSCGMASQGAKRDRRAVQPRRSYGPASHGGPRSAANASYVPGEVIHEELVSKRDEAEHRQLGQPREMAPATGCRGSLPFLLGTSATWGTSRAEVLGCSASILIEACQRHARTDAPTQPRGTAVPNALSSPDGSHQARSRSGRTGPAQFRCRTPP